MRGSVYRRGATWTARWDVPGPTRRQRSKGGFPTRKAAEQFLTEQLRRGDQGIATTSDRIRLSDFAERWLEAIRHDVTASTWKGYESKWRLYLEPAIGHVRIGDLTATELKALWSDLLARGLSPRSVQYARATIRKMYADAISWEVVARNPVEGAKAPKVERAPKRTWEASDTARFLAHVAGDRWEAMWWTLCDTGCRRSELCNLEVEDLDLRAGTLTIRRGKTESARRTVALLPETVELLRQWRIRVLEERVAAGESWRETGRLFVWPDGRPIKVDWVSHTFARLRAEAGVPRIKLHELRHSWATQALAEGVSSAEVKDRLGHSSIKVTIDFYTAVPDDTARKAAEKVGARWRAHDAHDGERGEGSVTSIDAAEPRSDERKRAQ